MVARPGGTEAGTGSAAAGTRPVSAARRVAPAAYTSQAGVGSGITNGGSHTGFVVNAFGKCVGYTEDYLDPIPRV